MTNKNERGHAILVKIAMMVYDAIAVNASIFLAIILRFYVRFEFHNGAEQYIPVFWNTVPVLTIVSLVIFYFAHLYNTVWEYADGHDVLNILFASVLTDVAYVAMTLVFFGQMPLSVYLLSPIIQSGLIFISRFGYRLYLLERNNHIIKDDQVKKTMIIGVDGLGRFARTKVDASTTQTAVCMLDATDTTPNRYLNGMPVIGGMDNIERAIEAYHIQKVVIADAKLSSESIKRIKELCEEKQVDVDNLIEYLQSNNDLAQPANIAVENGARVIPFSPPDISDKEISEVVQALKSGWITTGPRTKELEKRLAAFCHTSKVVCLNSATAAEELNFRVCGIGEGDEVIVPAMTYTATASAAIHCGAKVVFVDSQKDNCEMDYDKLEAAITEKTKAIVAVDLGGIIADYDRIYEIVERKKSLFKAKKGNSLGARIQQSVDRVLVFADCAHALGASRNGKQAGEIADFTDFSFHAVKNFTTAEGGAATWCDIPGVSNDEVYRQYQLYSLHGQSKDALAKTMLGAWEYDIVGPWYKCNMTDIMAAIGLRQLDRYPGLMARRKEIIRRYDAMCDELGVKHLIHYTDTSTSSGHLYITRIPGVTDEQRREIIIELARRGVSTNVHYKPLPMMTAYKELGWDIKDFPNAYAYYENLITLPLHTKLSDEDVEYVMKNYTEVVSEKLRSIGKEHSVNLTV